MQSPLRYAMLARLMLIVIAVIAHAARGQVAVANVADSSGDTNKTPGFSVRKEQRNVSDAFEDFERYRDKKAWEKAFTSIAKIEEGKPGRLVPDKDGFYVPTDLKVRAELLSLPPDGREAYRLFNDAKATKLLKDLTPADGTLPADEIEGLNRIVNRYFVTSIGDQAADRLGDALFETGDFSNARRCWELILDNYPDSSLSPVLLQTKRAIALARAGEWDAFESARSVLHDRYSGQTARIGGEDVPALAYVESLRTESSPATQSSPGESQQTPSTMARQSSEDSPVLPESDRPAWQIPIMDAQFSALLVGQLSQNGWQNMAAQFSSAVPGTAVDNDRIYVNWLGICFAADLKTGKMLWRTDSFADMPQKMAQSLMQGINIDTKSYAAAVVGENVIFTRRNTDNQDYNQMPMTRLLCVNGAKGKAVWKSESGPLAGWGFVGTPLVKGDVFYSVAHAANSQDMSLLCVGVDKGEVRWKADLGTPASSMTWRGSPTVPMPVLMEHSGKVYILTNNGAFLQVDRTSHQIDWALSYPTYVESQQQYYGYAQPDPIIAPGSILVEGTTVYFKESSNALLFAIDPSGPSVKWKRRIDSCDGLACFDGRHLMMAGPEVESVDGSSRALQWSVKTSISTSTIQPLIQGDWLYQYGCRGIDSIRLSTGENGKRFRGADHDADGGIIWKTPARLVTVSSRAITAYLLPSAGK